MPRILVVEDNEMNRDMLSRWLTRHGFEVTVAVDGGEAIAVTQSLRPDLVVMDMGLPGIDGWEATRLLKADAATCHIPVIALTAHAFAADRKRGMEAGCDDYDIKPVDFARLLSKIQVLLEKAMTR